MTPNRGSGPQFGKTVYISKFNGGRKVTFNVQLAMNKISDPHAKIFRGVWERVPQLKFFHTSEIVGKQVELESSYSAAG